MKDFLSISKQSVEVIYSTEPFDFEIRLEIFYHMSRNRNKNLIF